jgi:hypothetical protein
MKLNRSLAISTKIQECKMGNIIGVLEKEFPASIFEEPPLEKIDIKSRQRVFTHANTLMTMTLAATQKDKSLKNSVQLYYMIHQENKRQVLKTLQEQMEIERESNLIKTKKAGRPKKYTVRLRSSLDKDISLNTAAYSKARERLPLEMAKKFFLASRIQEAENPYAHWHGYRVMIGDGTYLQMQDTQSLKAVYEVKHEGGVSEAYPQGLLEAIIERGTGQIYGYSLGNRHVSELSLFYGMIDTLPSDSLLLLDDLYNCYEILSKCKQAGVELVVPAKRDRNYEIVEELGEGDEIVRIKAPKTRSPWLKDHNNEDGALPALLGTLLLRRIRCKSPDGTVYVLVTTILDPEISKEDIQILYLTRYDIEISIREVKTVMDINILRSKTPDMALKELSVALATYNLIRKVIYASIKDLPFSPKEDFIFKFYTLNKELHIDKKGRVYNRWSTGRRRAV